MAVKDINILKTAKVALKPVRLHLGTTANSQTAAATDAVVPGFAFEVDRVEVMALTVTATISVDVQISGTSVLTGVITPVAATPTLGVLSSTAATVRGASTDTLAVKYTSNGSGAATNAAVTVWIRPLPLNGEVYDI